MTAIAEAPITARKFAHGSSFFRSALNPLLATDCYKIGHMALYPAGTERILSAYTNRGSRVEGIDGVVHFGLQAFLVEYAMNGFAAFFASDVDDVCAEYERRITQVIGKNKIGSDHIRALHALGYLPLRFCAVPEGTIVPLRVPSFTVENTIDEFFWLTNYIETVLSASVWQASTSATLSWHIRQMFNRNAMHTGSDIAAVDWQGHDFSFRGMPGVEAASASSAGHLLSFTGSDTLASLDWIDNFYPGSPEDEIILGSIPATEHSVMCAGTAYESEFAAFERVLDVHDEGNVAIVADTYNLWIAITEFLPKLRDRIMAREGGKVVIRPDSGDPADIICGNPNAEPGTPEFKGAMELLWEVFGGTTNSKNFKVLDSHIGLIYGDSIYYERAEEIFARLAAKGFASVNIVFGLGSYFYQYRTRDTFASAVKAVWSQTNGKGYDLIKDPITDDGTKKSATGRLAVGQMMSGKIYLIEKATPEQEARSLLQPIWENGEFLKFQSFHDVRETLKRSTGIRQRMLSRDQH